MSDETSRHAIVEIFGHRKRAGRVREVSEFGVTMLEIEVPKRDGSIEIERYGGSAIFGMRFVSEEEARREAERLWPWEATSPQLPASAGEPEPFEGEVEEEEPGDEHDGERDEHEEGGIGA